MEGKLNEDGTFAAKRGAKWVDFLCPYLDGATPCGEWCPQMSEPIRQTNKKNGHMETVVHICQGRHWKFTEFEDRRGVT